MRNKNKEERIVRNRTLYGKPRLSFVKKQHHPTKKGYGINKEQYDLLRIMVALKRLINHAMYFSWVGVMIHAKR